jgi:hypothetical protein
MKLDLFSNKSYCLKSHEALLVVTWEKFIDLWGFYLMQGNYLMETLLLGMFIVYYILSCNDGIYRPL